MTSMGELALGLAVVASALTVLACLVAVRFANDRAIQVARLAMIGVTAMFLLAANTLIGALVRSDFSVHYVARFTDHTLPMGYKLAAFWAGQEGSLLLWAVLLAVMATVAALTLPKTQIASTAAAIATLAVVCGFFGALLLFAANPFAIASPVPADGHGLNPLLRDAGMIAHPPMLFLGYAGFTVPFALMVAALLTGQTDDRWINATRRWALVAWLFLTVGILLGANWAYTVLGWGGYWGWDPVENASLLPWLTATAFLHSLMVQQHRGMFRLSNVALLAVTFILCIFGTYLTRSGIIDSVHGFGQSNVGTFFLVFLVIIVVFSFGLILARIPRLRPQQKLDGLIGREGAFLAVNALLVGMMLVVLVGTLFPIISGWFGTRTTLGAPFYNKVVGPVGFALVALMAVGPILQYGANAARTFSRGVIPPSIAALLVVVGLAIGRVHQPWVMLCAALTTALLVTYLLDLAKAWGQRIRKLNENPLLAGFRLFDVNHRRYGGQLAHLGFMLVVVGITGSSLFSVKDTHALADGESFAFAGGSLTLKSVAENDTPACSSIVATVVWTDNRGQAVELHPARQFFTKWEDQPSSLIAIDSNWRRDIYLNLAGWEPNASGATIQAIRNPLISLIWLGGWLLASGACFSILPRIETIFIRQTREQTDLESLPAVSSVPHVQAA